MLQFFWQLPFFEGRVSRGLPLLIWRGTRYYPALMAKRDRSLGGGSKVSGAMLGPPTSLHLFTTG